MWVFLRELVGVWPSVAVVRVRNIDDVSSEKFLMGV
jgi:hypothetical protein